MEMKDGARCVAVSKDDRLIAAGSADSEVIVCDAATYEQVFADKARIYKDTIIIVIYAADFSPDSTQLVTTSSNGTAIVLDIATRMRVRTFHHAATWGARGQVLSAR